MFPTVMLDQTSKAKWLIATVIVASFLTNANAGDKKTRGKKESCAECEKQKTATKTQVMISKRDGADKKTNNSQQTATQKSPNDKNDQHPEQSIQQQVQALAAGLSDLPPNPKPGECYVRVKQPVQYVVVPEKVLVQEATIRYETVPAQFKDVEKKVLVQPETIRYEVIPAKYETKMVEVVLSPEHKELTAVDTKFKDKKDKVEVLPERVYWQRGAVPLDKSGDMTDDILCLVREHPEYKEFTKKLVDKEAKLETKPIQARTQKVPTQVLVKAAEVKEIKVPAEYKTIKVRELVKPASSKKVEVPAKYITVQRQQLISPERMVWRRVLCKTNVTRDVVQRIQESLKKKGFDPGRDNGQLDPPTCEAIKRYQQKHDLPEGGLTYEFLDHIGVRP